MKVFVYGTLRTGDIRHGVEGFVKMIALEAHIEGFDMLNLGGFPGLIEGDGRIRGEVHEYEHMQALDRIEGYRESAPESGLYTRIQVTAEVEVEGVTEELEDCWVYLYNRGSERSRDRIIQSGDWFEHRGLYDKSTNVA